MSIESKVVLQTTQGQQEITVGLNEYKEAEDKGLRLSQLLNQKYPTNIAAHGTAFEQAVASCGLVMSEDRNFGIKPPSLKSIFDGSASLNGTSIVRGDGTERHTPAGRLLFPALLIDMLEDQLRDNKESYNAQFMEMVAFTRTINSPKYDQVIIDYSKPREARGSRISQLAEPNRMLSITTSSVSRSIPTYSIGMEISKEALQAATLDLIGLALREHGAEERSDRIENDFINIVNGNVDTGDVALASITAQSLDATISAAGSLTQRAWVKYLRQKWRKRTLTHVVCDIDTYLAIEARSGRVTSQNNTATDERLNPIPVAVNGGVDGVKVFITETSILGANTMVGLDASKAMRRIVYSGADYNAIEEFAMRKSTALRIDWAERIEQAGYTEAFEKMTLTV